MEKRRYQRIRMRNLQVDASDGVGFLQGAVVDASRSGISVAHLQRRRGGQPMTMTFIVSGQRENFKMIVRPRWSIVHGAGKSVGVEIIDPPRRWTEFIMKFEQPPQDTD